MVPATRVTGHNDRRVVATTTAVPEVQLVTIEHPCIIKSFDNGFKSMGGEQQVKHILENDSDRDDRPRKAQRREQSGPVVGVSLDPHDPLAKKLESTSTSTHNVLVKVTLPKRTGRKRKRGTNDTFTSATTNASGHQILAPDLFRRLQDNASKYIVEAVGKVETSHRFNALPDLRIRERDVPVMRELRQHAMTPDYDVLKKFHIDLRPGTAGISALPRPDCFIPPGVNTEDPFDLHSALEVTTKPPSSVYPKKNLNFAPGAEVPTNLKPLVESLKAFLESRPIATRLVLQHAFPNVQAGRLDAAATWAGTKAKGGPWKDCVVKNGVDPYSDPQYRIYQIVAVRPQNNKEAKDDSGSHIFDGVMKTKGRTYQYCDITDPALASVINTSHFRSKEEGYGGPACGWYHNGSAAKIRTLMTDKLKRMHSPVLQLDDRAYAAVAALPDMVEEGTVCEVDGKVFGAEAKILGAAVRKEALRLGKEAVEGGRGGVVNGAENNDVDDGREGVEDTVATNAMVIDPSLLEESQSAAVEEVVRAPVADATQPVHGTNVELAVDAMQM